MNAEDRLRRLALDLPDAVEGSHMGAADFRLNGRIFATLAYAARGQATLMLSPEQQQAFLNELPQYAEPAAGSWGRKGMTLLRLDAPEEILRGALRTAYHNLQAKQEASRARPARVKSRPAKPKLSL